MNRVKDRVRVATGAALGIGRACALTPVEESARVALLNVLDMEGLARPADCMRLGPRAIHSAGVLTQNYGSLPAVAGGP